MSVGVRVSVRVSVSVSVSGMTQRPPAIQHFDNVAGSADDAERHDNLTLHIFKLENK